MGETLVLANLSIDSAGVVTGIRQSNAALASGEQGMNKFGAASAAVGSTADVVVGKLFNFRQAFSAVARSLGVVGLITGLAFALKGLVGDLIENTTWFKNAKEAVTDWWREITNGEGAIDRLTRKLKDIGSASGVKSVAEMKKALFDLVSARQLAEITGIEEKESMEDRLITWNLYQSAIQKAVDALHKLGVSEQFLRDNTAVGAGRVGEVGPSQAAALPWDPQKYTDAANRIGAAMVKIEEATVADAAAAEQDAEAYRPLNLLVLENARARALQNSALDATIEEFELSQIVLEGVHLSADKAAATIDTVAANLEKSAMKAQLMQLSFVAMGQAIGAAAAGAGSSSKRFFGEILVGLAQVLAAWGATLIAEGIASDNYGKVAAGIAAIAAAAIASSAAQKYSQAAAESSSGGSGRGQTQAPLDPGRGGGHTTNITVVVHGSMIGTDENNLGRDILRLVRTAEADGSA